MALPTAPLGQLPNMSTPYMVPTYNKTSASQQALAAFLAQMAGSVGGQIGNNALSRDYADKPAGFWSKLVNGPVENRTQKSQADLQAFEKGEHAMDRAAQSKLAENAQMNAYNIAGLREEGDNKRLEQTLQSQKIAEFLRSGQALSGDAMHEAGANKRNQADIDARKALYGPGQEADAKYKLAEAEKTFTMNEFLKKGLGQGTSATGGAPGASPADIEAAKAQMKSGGTGGQSYGYGPSDSQQQQSFQINPSDVQGLLAQGMSPQQIQEAQARQARTTQIAALLKNRDDVTAETQAAMQQELLKRMGIQPRPSAIQLMGANQGFPTSGY